MVVVPAGSFMMGSSPPEIAALMKDYPSHRSAGPRHKVTIARAFAVGKFEVTFAEWDACIAAGGCKHRPDDRGWGRGKRR
jgi:formylglycine-generating enzyme required for sulfatase activity